MSFDLTKCDPICIECIKNYSKKFGLKKGDPFKIKCSGIPQEYVSDEIANKLQSDKESIECMINPVYWAAKFLDWHCIDPEGEVWKRKTDTGRLMGFPPYDEELAKIGKSVYHRPYQKLLMECSARRKVFRIGRQCIAENTLISLDDGILLKIQDVKPGDYVLTYNYCDEIIEPKPVVDVIDQGIKLTFRIKTESYSFSCTSDHKIFTNYGWRSIEEGLKPGDFVLTEFLNWEEIEEIKFDKRQRVWDLSVFDNHNFFANSVLVKNCGKTSVLCINILFNIFTNDHFNAQIIAPYQAQVDIIFKRLNDLIDVNPLLINSVLRRTNKTPNTIELKNGSIVMGFPAGVKTGQDSGSSRGQCLVAGTKVLLANNETKNIEDIQVGDSVYSHGCGWLPTQAKVTYVFNPRNVKVYEIITKSGKKIQASENHKFFNFVGEVELGDLDVGDQIKIHTPVDNKNFYIDISFDYIVNKKYVGVRKTYDIEVAETQRFVANGIIVHNSAGMLLYDECFTEDTLILTKEGNKSIKDLSLEDKIISFDKNQVLFQDEIEIIKKTGDKFVKKYYLENGLSVICTPNHPVWDGEKFIEIDKAEYLFANTKQFRKKDNNLIKIALYTSIICDGWAFINKKNIKIIGFSGSIDGLKKIQEDVRQLVPSYNGKIYSRQTCSPKYNIRGQTNSIILGKLLWDQLEYLNFPLGKKVEQPFLISDVIMNGNIEEKRVFLSVLFGAEGNTPATDIDDKSFKTISVTFHKLEKLESYLIAFSNQIQKLLLDFNIKSRIIKYNGDIKVNKLKDEKRVKYEIRISNSKENLSTFFKEISFTYEPLKEQLSEYLAEYISVYNGKTGDNLRKNNRHFKKPTFEVFLSEKLENNFFKFKIINKEDVGIKPVFNLKTKNYHTFFANNIAVHNCDMLSRADIDSALAVTINFPQSTVLMSSTPTGKRELFYETCTTDKFYKEFHFSSYVNPNWNEEMEAFFRSSLTEDGYISEIEALFPSLEGGVYKQKFIDAAQSNYNYGFFRPNPAWMYTIGVDWNDVKIGTTIAVVGYNPTDGIFYLVDKQIISQVDRTQLAACDKIIELNRYWNPMYVYVDKGFGCGQVEILHDFGLRSIKISGANSPDAKLRTIVKGYDFGSTVDIFDPFTKQPVKKPSKPFLVDNSVLKFEQHRFKYPIHDEDFTKQLQNYVIDRISIYGRPVYKGKSEEIGDHFLDAVNLALVAFALEKEKFSKPKYSADIAVTNNFKGEKKEEVKLYTEEAVEHKPKNSRDIRNNNSILAIVNSKNKDKATTRSSTFLKRKTRPVLKPKRNNI